VYAFEVASTHLDAEEFRFAKSPNLDSGDNPIRNFVSV
jgi:hypothetical protein